MSISKASTQNLIVCSAVVAAIVLYWAAVAGLATKNPVPVSWQSDIIIAAKPSADANKLPHNTTQEKQKRGYGFNQNSLLKGWRPERIDFIFEEFPTGHPYGRRVESNVIILSPRQSDIYGQPGLSIDRSFLQHRMEIDGRRSNAEKK